MLIGKVEQKTGFSKDTIRYYEKFGLISPDHRRESNYKEYSEETVKVLLFIKRIKKVGFTLREIKEIINLFMEESYTCETITEMASSKIREIDQKVKQLNGFKRKLILAINTCQKYSPQQLCPTIENMWDA